MKYIILDAILFPIVFFVVFLIIPEDLPNALLAIIGVMLSGINTVIVMHIHD